MRKFTPVCTLAKKEKLKQIHRRSGTPCKYET